MLQTANWLQTGFAMLAKPVCSITIGQSLFDGLEAELSSHSISW